MQLLKDLYMVDCAAYGVRDVNLYAIKHNEGIILIDTGWPNYSAPIILEKLEYWGLGELPITHVLLTHWHSDHAGNAKIFRDKGAKIIASDLDADYIEMGKPDVYFPFDETDYFFDFDPCQVDMRIHGEQEFQIADLDVHVYPIPGHSAGCVAYEILLHNQKLLFVGDALSVHERNQATYSTFTCDPTYNFDDYLESLKNLSLLKPYGVFGGHGIVRIGNDSQLVLRAAYRDILGHKVGG